MPQCMFGSFALGAVLAVYIQDICVTHRGAWLHHTHFLCPELGQCLVFHVCTYVCFLSVS